MCGVPHTQPKGYKPSSIHLDPSHFLRSAFPSPASSPPLTPALAVDADADFDFLPPLTSSGPQPSLRNEEDQALMERQILAFAENGIGSALDQL